MRLVKCLILALTLSLGVGSAFAQSIDLFSDLAATSCQANMAPGSTPVFYIQARSGALAPEGITGAEFWVENFPAGWLSIVTPNPAASVALGSPLATASPFRANISFATCQAGPLILLYTITVIPTSVVGPTHLRVVIANPPSGAYTTPIVTKCDPPNFTAVEAAGGQFFINDASVQCTVGVTESTWSRVKELYAN